MIFRGGAAPAPVFARACSIFAALLLAGTAMPALAADEAATDTDNDIVVTAQKREQTLLEVPQAVQVLSGDQLREDGVKSFVDLSQHTPGVIVSTPLVGGSTVQNFTIAGFVRNLTDKTYSTGGSSIARISGAPRTWGGSLGVRF